MDAVGLAAWGRLLKEAPSRERQIDPSPRTGLVFFPGEDALAKPPKTITRADLVETVSEATRLSRAESGKIVTRVFEVIEATLVRSQTVKLSRFGNFVVRKKRQRIGRNPKTGREVPITPRKVVTFRPSQLMKEQVAKGARPASTKARRPQR
jgi:integration host factor subunit alpha